MTTLWNDTIRLLVNVNGSKPGNLDAGTDQDREKWKLLIWKVILICFCHICFVVFLGV